MSNVELLSDDGVELRVGVDAVQLRPDQAESSALRALGLVTDHYQGDVHQPRPLFARVAA